MIPQSKGNVEMSKHETPSISVPGDMDGIGFVSAFTLKMLRWISFHLRSLPGSGSPIQMAGLTDKGARRKNQDCIYMSQAVPNITVAVASDGLGGEVAGDVAARICINAFKQCFSSQRKLAQWVKENGLKTGDPMWTLCRLMEESNSEILKQTPGSAIMGATCTAALIQKREDSHVLHWGHAGDSRLYLIHKRAIHQLTSDHTWGQIQSDKGLLTPRQAEEHPKKHHLANFLGIGSSLDIETGIRQLCSGDAIVICTDGISNEISDEQLTSVVLQESPRDAYRILIDMAKRQGGSMADNMSVIVIKLGDPQDIQDLPNGTPLM